MAIGTVLRMGRDRMGPAATRSTYRACAKKVGEFKILLSNGERHLARRAGIDLTHFMFRGLKPVQDQTLDRARAAATWLVRAQDATGDDGVSYGFFPGRFAGGWGASYPETTGYIIQTLIEYGQRHNAAELLERAIRMARWEISVQMANGAVQGGPLVPPERQTPAVFNTGMVLQGYTAAYRLTRAAEFLDAGRRAAHFLIGDLDEHYFFRTNGSFVGANQRKTYNCLCAWAMYRFGEDSGDARFVNAAVRVVEAALMEQRPNGWIGSNCLSRPEAPLTHTIGYALQGMLEVGVLSGRVEFVRAVRRSLDSLISRISQDGFLAGRFYSDWKPAALSSCLTGAAQLAIVCYRTFQICGDHRYRDAADRMVNFLKALQPFETEHQEVNGALPGSYPITGDYMYLGYPNWATKYMLDALMLQHDVRCGTPIVLSGPPTW